MEWLVDVLERQSPIEEGILYGNIPSGTRQTYPKAERPSPLKAGETYYLHVQEDVARPVVRCLFQYN